MSIVSKFYTTFGHCQFIFSSVTMGIPAGGSKTEPSSKGKEDVLCFYCGKKMRKDTLRRHSEKQHEGKVLKFKLVTTGMDALDSLGFFS